MYIALLGRQPELGIAELERIYGSENVSWFSKNTARVEAKHIDVTQLGGVIKVGEIVAEFPNGAWHDVSKKIVQFYTEMWKDSDNKITLGISAYGFPISPRDVQKTGLILKSQLKKYNTSLRLVPNTEEALSSATSHHNKLGLSATKKELLVIKVQAGRIVIAESLGAQNITALASRDQGRPKRDAFVGMLPPKLALLIVNLASGNLSGNKGLTLLDPFCGTGVILQEAMLRHFSAYGTDLSEKMVRYTRDNLNWLQEKYELHSEWYLHEGDAMNTKWRSPVDVVACETYLGQPFSAPPSQDKLREVRGNCNHIIGEFLTNISVQLSPGTPLCIAVPAWRDARGDITYLPLTRKISDFGFKEIELKNVRREQMVYYREDQVVARQLLILEKL